MHFPHLLGNERLKQTFASLPLSRLGSAIILNGPAGCGKVTVAKDIAAAILCTGEHKPCGVCPSCIRFNAGSNSDFELFGDTESAPKIDEVRALRSRSFIKSGDSGLKVFVIANADRLNPPSQNALLKVLEEPMNTVFILTCVNYLTLLQTVRSRCTVYQVEPLPSEVIYSELSKESSAAPDDIKRASELCGGSLELARGILSQGAPASENAASVFLSSLGDELSIYKATSVLSSLSRDEYAAFCIRASEIISMELARGAAPQKLIKIYDHLDEQLKLMPQNPSVSALAGELSAFCGELTEE